MAKRETRETREELEKILGEPEDFIISSSNAPMVRSWAMQAGFHPAEVMLLTTVQLANLYHKHAGKDKPKRSDEELQRLGADLFVKIMTAIQVPGFNVELMREIASDQFSSEAAKLDAEIKRMINELPPRRIEIVTPAGSRIIEGPMHYLTADVIQTASLAHPIMLVGPAGCGKTTIGQHTAQALNLPFYITSTINDTHELTGFIDGYGKYHSTPFRQAFEFGGVWVADEIDAWDAAALLAANSALANGYAYFPDRDEPIGRNANFRMVATANTFGNGADRVYIGRNELDAASLDRFAVLEVDYDLTLERLFANGNQRWLERVWKVRKIVSEKKIRHVVSSRAIAMGSAALAAGMKWEDVENRYLFKGMTANDRSKIDG